MLLKQASCEKIFRQRIGLKYNKYRWLAESDSNKPNLLQVQAVILSNFVLLLSSFGHKETFLGPSKFITYQNSKIISVVVDFGISPGCGILSNQILPGASKKPCFHGCHWLSSYFLHYLKYLDIFHRATRIETSDLIGITHSNSF